MKQDWMKKKATQIWNFSTIWIQRLFQRLIWINHQTCTKKNLLTYLLKTLETFNYSKISPIFTYIWTFGFGFGIRPKTRCFSGQIFWWKSYFRSFSGGALSTILIWLCDFFAFYFSPPPKPKIYSGGFLTLKTCIINPIQWIEIIKVDLKHVQAHW